VVKTEKQKNNQDKNRFAWVLDKNQEATVKTTKSLDLETFASI